jgi:uncharacterized protein YraI
MDGASSEPSADLASPEAQQSDGGARVRVVGTEGQGLKLRSGPGLNAPTLKTLREGSILISLGGSTQSDGFTWLNVSEPGGPRGWVAAKYVENL